MNQDLHILRSPGKVMINLKWSYLLVNYMNVSKQNKSQSMETQARDRITSLISTVENCHQKNDKDKMF